MMRPHLGFAVLTLVTAGCVDTVDTVAREYRNSNNEVIDAMMVITTESQADGMTARIFKPMNDRYDAIDRKLTILITNRTKKEIVNEVYESEGVHMYLVELEINRQRYALEMTRLRNLHRQLVDAHQECPKLDEIVNKEDTLKKLRDQLNNPEFMKLMNQFGTYKVENYPAILAKFNERRKLFELKKDIILVAPN